jgi:hypothetical protein
VGGSPLLRVWLDVAAWRFVRVPADTTMQQQPLPAIIVEVVDAVADTLCSC